MLADSRDRHQRLELLQDLGQSQRTGISASSTLDFAVASMVAELARV